jgi:hypothetical protein
MTPEIARISIEDRFLTVAFERSERATTHSGFELMQSRLPFVDRLRRDIEAYRRLPATEEGRAVARLPVRFDLDEPDADQDAGNGSSA